MIAPPIPWKARARLRKSALGASPHSSEPAVNATIPIANSSRRP